jgi:hypothetical protein
MSDMNPKLLLGIGVPLLLLGFLLPLLMVLQILPSTFFLNFFSYGASFLGLLLGLLGAMSIAVRNRNKRR